MQVKFGHTLISHRPMQCFVHVPKSGGTSVERAFQLQHAHRRANCSHSIAIVRDPIDRLSSAYHFCKKSPWDNVLARRKWPTTLHCCHSSMLQRDFSAWLLSIFEHKVGCILPGAGFPHPYTASTSYWLAASRTTTFLRTNCLEKDGERLLGVRLPKTNTSPNRNCNQNLTTAAWSAILGTAHHKDFQTLYHKNFRRIDDWRRVCETFRC